MDPLTIFSLARFLTPLAGDAIAALFSNDGNKQTARSVTITVGGAALQIAQQVTGIPITDEASAQLAAATLQADPAKLAEFQRQMGEPALQAFRAETERLAIVNETMCTELASEDPYVRHWRPLSNDIPNWAFRELGAAGLR